MFQNIQANALLESNSNMLNILLNVSEYTGKYTWVKKFKYAEYITECLEIYR